jgi:hypothetical protein
MDQMKPRQTNDMPTSKKCPWLLARALVSLVEGVFGATSLGEENICFSFYLSLFPEK